MGQCLRHYTGTLATKSRVATSHPSSTERKQAHLSTFVVCKGTNGSSNTLCTVSLGEEVYLGLKIIWQSIHFVWASSDTCQYWLHIRLQMNVWMHTMSAICPNTHDMPQHTLLDHKL